MIFQQKLIDFQANLTRNSNNVLEISEQELKDSRWKKFCDDEKIGLDFQSVGIKDLKQIHPFGKTQIGQWIVSQNKNLVFYGAPGSGKTHSALCLLRHFYERGLWVRYVHDYQICEKGKENGTSYLNKIYGEPHILVIDDLGVSSVAEWEIKYYHTILDTRYGAKRPSIITTNLNENEIEEKYTKRLKSRMPSEWVRFQDFDNRVFGFKE